MNLNEFFSNLKNKTIDLIQKVRSFVFIFFTNTRTKAVNFSNKVNNKVRYFIKIAKIKATLLKEAKNSKEIKPKGTLNKLNLIKLSLSNTLERISSDNSTKVLIVEDENVLADVLEEKFKKAKFSVKIATDGEIAVGIAKIFLPDVILLDLMLPKKDGFYVLEELKGYDDTKRIPIIIMSNLSDDENIKRALKMGATDYFVKSNHPINEVIEKVKKIIMDSK